MLRHKFFESNELLENPLFHNVENFDNEFSNEYIHTFEFQNNSSKDESSSNFNEHDLYFYNNNKNMNEINNNEDIKENENKEKNKNIDNIFKENDKFNPFVQNKVNNEIDISKKENFKEKTILETTDLTNKKLNTNISQEKQNKNINQINSNLNKINSVNLSIDATQSIKYINNNNFLGKKRENNYISFSDKYIKKVRILIIKMIIIFINDLIIKFTNNDIGKGMCEKKFVEINKKDLTHSPVEYDKEFLNKKIKEILSSISKKFTNVLPKNNKELLEYLLNLKDKGKYFQELFDLSFLDCLEHIRGNKNNELLNGFPTIDKIIEKEMKSLSKYNLAHLKSCFVNYKELVENKKSRKSKNNQNKK